MKYKPFLQHIHPSRSFLLNWLQFMVPSFSLCINLASVLNKTFGFARFIEVFQLKSTQPPLLRVVTVRPAQPSWTQKPNVGSGGGITWGLSSMGLNTAPVCSGPLVAKKNLILESCRRRFSQSKTHPRISPEWGWMSQWFTEEWIDLKGTYFQPKAFRKSARKIRETVESVETLVSSWVFFVLPEPEAPRTCQFFTKWQLTTGESGPLLLSRRLRDGNLEREDLRLKMSTLLAFWQVDRPYGSLNSQKLTSIKNLRIYKRLSQESFIQCEAPQL